MSLANGFLLTKNRFGADTLLNLAGFAFVAEAGCGTKLYPLSFNERYFGMATDCDLPLDAFARVPGFAPMTLFRGHGTSTACMVNLAFVKRVSDLGDLRDVHLVDPTGRTEDLRTDVPLREIMDRIAGKPGHPHGPTVVMG